ncbi:hypothetical protein [Streptomyces yaizuensis]|uniref:Membrane protein n=1 Tax=Streptomyces yaizuensis TaxID=2989713 RepID=A0ABQ5NUS0_9ACTN|nr:hypothetical protein [Streptomyces sp. YSPA8]GLF94108.1 membrane protein [Streptomyces sp. YSPA8]
MDSSELDRADGRRGARRRGPLIGVAVAVVLVASGAGTYIAAADRGGDGPAKDRTTTAGEAAGTRGDTGAAAPPPALSVPPESPESLATPAPGGPGPSGGTVYRAAGELPEGPARATVYRPVGSVSAAEATRLARALGLTGEVPRSSGAEWVIGAGKDGAEPSLRVAKAAPGTWSYSAFGGGSGSDDCRRGRDCPAQTPGAGAGDAPGERAATDAAGPVLRALGLANASVSARQAVGAVRVVTADPVVGGSVTFGWSTELRIGAGGAVVGGSGRFTEVEKAGAEKVLSAAKTLEGLNRESRILAPCGIDLPHATGPALKPGAVPHAATSARTTARGAQSPPRIPCGHCATDLPADGQGDAEITCSKAMPPAAPRRLTVTSAVLGLSLQYPDGTPALVPSWLFRVEPRQAGQQPYTLARPAPASWPALSSSGKGREAAPVPDEPSEPVEPVEPPAAKEPPNPPEAVPGSPSYSVSGRKLTVTFWGGICDDHRLTVKESDDRVVAEVVRTPDPGEVCAAVAKELRESAVLDRPLGDRKVVDAETGKALARS